MISEETQNISIGNRNRIALAYLCMARDKRFLKLTELERIKLIHGALSFGDSVAKGVENEFGTTEPREIARLMGLRVIGEDRGIQGTLLKRSEYRPKTKDIVIYRDSLNQMMREVAAEDLSDRLMKLLIAHELFHHLEHTRFGPTPERLKIHKWSLGPIEHVVKIRTAGEVSAHAFAETLLDIKQSPMVFDYFTYIFYSSRGQF